MESEELSELMKQIEEKGIGWDKVEEETKIPELLSDIHSYLLYYST